MTKKISPKITEDITEEISAKEILVKDIPTEDISAKEVLVKDIPMEEIPVKETPKVEEIIKKTFVKNIPTEKIPETDTSKISLLSSIPFKVSPGVDESSHPYFTADVKGLCLALARESRRTTFNSFESYFKTVLLLINEPLKDTAEINLDVISNTIASSTNLSTKAVKLLIKRTIMK